ncbi:SusD/RagB family nutrient-binding outer membrane lipoprotein [Chitinophaga lutea]|uniref:SusD/RagB family nutrient-binding outer membrane lipoprotein n=1 Tax=Chitinophaga lutea TaxID=2488634 RepID=A0A3N4Q0H4_9BACT|nr:SusD/RagB family nutrient-binding outer membrane lipoprotein [Chitinophaga lutea]RPE09450.1 SusD/RagB family nutrient-binding outer membrane lipoprotein [Chitinophaga lutea]
MNIKHKLGIGVLALATFASSCTKDFAEKNSDQEVAPVVPPEVMISASQKGIVDRDFEWYYDNYGFLMRWMQFTVASPEGNQPGMFGGQNTNGFYGAFYTSIGRNLVAIEKLISELPAEKQAAYRNIGAITAIHKVYAAFRVSDVNGSIPYTEALSARETANFTPKYDRQQDLFNLFDEQLKAAVTALQGAAAGQIGFGNADLFYTNASTAAANYAKTANVLRLKIAVRLLKRDATKAKQIIDDVMASPAGLYASNAEEWKFISGTQFARGGNWGAQGNNASAVSMNMIGFLKKYNDPRLALFYKKNGMTEERFNYIKTGGGFPATAVYNPDRYIGLPVSPDARQQAQYVSLYGTKTYSLKFPDGKKEDVTVDTLTRYQNRLFDLSMDGGANGQYTQPLISYAEQCFLLAELAVRGLITADAATWYNKGVTASVQAYDAMGKLAGIVDYAPVDAAAITAYLQKPEIALTGSTEEKLEKIGIQAFLNFFKAPHEAWNQWRRTGYPKKGGILSLEPVMIGGAEAVVPRRWMLPIPHSSNMTNYNNALSEMATTGEYGSPNDLTGRVWWDKQ